IASGPPFWVTEMFTTAGETFLTSGAKLCCWVSAAGDVMLSGAGAPAGGRVSAEFSAQTSGDSASVAPRPKPNAAARVLPRRSWRGPFSLHSANFSLLSNDMHTPLHER